VSRRSALRWAGAAACLPLLACSGGPPAPDTNSVSQAPIDAGEPRYGGTLSLRFFNNPPLDPIANVTFLAQWLAGYVYSRLLKFRVGPDPAYASDYLVEEDLAQGYEMSPDGLTWAFWLRGDARFHDLPPLNGRLVDSTDVAMTLARFREEPRNANRAAFGGGRNPIVDKVETPDARLLVVRLMRPYAPFANLVAAVPLGAAQGGRPGAHRSE
jgi:peptide/nickel transport system substrate-binding protein